MFQFIHVETYALKASTKQRPVKPPKDGKAPINPTKVKNKYSAGQIIDEVLREPHAVPHVENPQKPNFVLGSEDDLRTLIPGLKRRQLPTRIRRTVENSGRMLMFYWPG